MQQLSRTEMEELFRILDRAQCPYTCNNHGVFINLSWVPEAVIQDIEKFISYCDTCREELDRYDNLQSSYSDLMKATGGNKNSKEGGSRSRKKSVAESGSGVTGGAGDADADADAVEEDSVQKNDDSKNRKTRGTGYSIKFYLLKKRLQKNTNLYNEWEDCLQPDHYVGG